MKIKKWNNFKLNEEVWDDEPETSLTSFEEPSMNEPGEDFEPYGQKDYKQGVIDCWDLVKDVITDEISVEDFYEEEILPLIEESVRESLSNLQKEYREYFRFMLDLYEVSSPTKLSKEKKKEFFDNVKKYWVKGKGVTKDLKKIEEDILGKEK